MNHMDGKLLNFFLESFSNKQETVKQENDAMKVKEDSPKDQSDSDKEHMEVGEFLKQTDHLEVYKNLAAMAAEAPSVMEMTTVKTLKKSGSMLGQIVMRARKDQGRARKVEQEKRTGGSEDFEDRKDNVTKYDEGEGNRQQPEIMGDYTETILIKNNNHSEDGKHGNTSNEDVDIIVETKTLTGTASTDMSPTSSPSEDMSAPATGMSPPLTNMSAPSTDMSPPLTNMSAPSTDRSAPSTDRSAPSTDRSAPSTDMSAPSTDMSLPSSTISSTLLVDSLDQLFQASPEAQTEDPDTLEVNMHQTLASVEVLAAQVGVER